MFKKVLVGTLLALAATGCTTTQTPAATSPASTEPTNTAPAPHPQGNSDEVVTENLWGDEVPSSTNPEQDLVEILRYNMDAERLFGTLSDQQIIDAAHLACTQLAAGVSLAELTVIEGEQPSTMMAGYEASSMIAVLAEDSLCSQ
ncbi:hypothetical protein [Leucobacter sp. 7(1)]|uniref:DUF732 domain-containing protein n=1 Tax=Leucobacter sp. 7(1) TaxID=1255613 RepID=UPI000B359FB3|nr:hypothetical protein [Leucobacter sp. 7(1)]